MIALPPTPDSPPQAGNNPAILLPACRVPVGVKSYVTITVNGEVICAGQIVPLRHHPRRHHHHTLGAVFTPGTR